MSVGRVVFAAVAAAIVAWMVWMFIQVEDRNDRTDSCASAGGVAVKSHLGPMVCIDRDAVIPDERWRP